MGKITIYDIAKKAGCSTATVSLALSGNPRIRPETTQRIREIAKELGYTPNYMAQSLSMQSTKTLGLIIPNIENPLFAQMVSGAEACANDYNYSIILGLSHSNREKEIAHFEMLQRERVDGLIILPTFLDSLQEKIANFPQFQSRIVLCGSSGVSLAKDFTYAKCDNRTGACLAISHLLETGKRRIGCIFPVTNETQCYSRKQGYLDALAKYNMHYDEQLIKLCPPNNDAIFKATTELLTEQKPDAIFCLYDYCAISVMRAIHSMKLHIPVDVAVIGYDNIPIAEHLPTSLSTIDTHSEAVGYKATELLIEKLRNPNAQIQQHIMLPELVIRESTAQS